MLRNFSVKVGYSPNPQRSFYRNCRVFFGPKPILLALLSAKTPVSALLGEFFSKVPPCGILNNVISATYTCQSLYVLSI